MSSVSSSSSLSSTSGSSLIAEKGGSITDKSRGGHIKKPGGASGSSSTSKIPAKSTHVASHRTAAKSSTLGKDLKEREAGGAKKSLTRAGGRAVAASLKSSAASHTDRPRTPVRRTTAVGPQAKREKAQSHAKPAVTHTTAASSPTTSTSQGKVRGIRTATSAKVKPLKIPPALKSNISFTELKKQHQVLLKDIDQLKGNLKEEASRHAEEMSELRNQLHSTQETVLTLQQELESKSAHSASQECLVSELQAKLERADIDKERLLLVLEGAHRDVMTGEEIATIQEEGANKQQKLEEFKQQVEEYERRLDDVMGSLEQTNHELKMQYMEMQDQYSQFQKQIYL